jgi:heat-inducible transcriptional repressor
VDLRGRRQRTAQDARASLLSDRQARVMRAVVTAFVADALPVGSKTVSQLLSVPLSSASIRNTMAELAERGLIEKPHSSSGRVPTEAGLRLFVDDLLLPQQVDSEQQRRLRNSFGATDVEGAMKLASHILSESTRQLGFVVTPRLARVRLRHITLVRMSRERLLVVLVTQAGRSYNRLIEDATSGDQAELDRAARVINDRVFGRTLGELRESLRAEASSLRNQAGSLLTRAVLLGQRALELAEEVEEGMDLLVATRLALLDQPEFNDPDRLREVLSAIEANERLTDLMETLIQDEGVSVALGGDLEDPGLQRCALITAPYGSTAMMTSPGDENDLPGAARRSSALGVLGVIGPSRMDYARIIPLVHYCSELVTEKFRESDPGSQTPQLDS